MGQPIEVLSPAPAPPIAVTVQADDMPPGPITPEWEPYVIRTGQVLLAVDALMPISPVSGRRSPAPSSLRGRRLGLAFFEDARFEVLVDAASRPAADTLAVGGRMSDQRVATFTLTSNAEGYLMTLQDLARARLFRVVGDIATGIGRVIEIDVTKLPPALCSPPLVRSGN
jgi:hypothetical protein